MKKLLSVSIMAMLAVSPMMAHADPVSNTHGPAAYDGQAANTPKAGTGIAAPFAEEGITTDDQAGVASAAYVKGAYNAAIRAVNTVAADVATAKAVTDGIENTIKTKINEAAGNGLTGANGVLSVNTAETVADGGTGYVTSNLLYDQGYQNATQVTNSIKGAAGTGLTAANDGTLSVNTANAVADGNTSYVTSDLLYDQDYQNATQVGTAISDAITDLNLGNTYEAKGAVEAKLDDGANGYDINAKTLKIQGADVATQTYADNAASTAQAAAISAAATDATTKANAAQAAAISAAATDATTKANAAQAAAISAAAEETESGVVNSINRATYSTTVTVPMYTAWGSGSTNSTTVATASTTASATYHNTAN